MLPAEGPLCKGPGAGGPWRVGGTARSLWLEPMSEEEGGREGTGTLWGGYGEDFGGTREERPWEGGLRAEEGGLRCSPVPSGGCREDRLRVRPEQGIRCRAPGVQVGGSRGLWKRSSCQGLVAPSWETRESGPHQG